MGLFRRPRLGQQLPLSGAVKATIVVEDEGERALASTTIDRLQRPLASLLQGAGATRRPFRIPSRLLRPRHRLACGLLHASVSSWSVARRRGSVGDRVVLSRSRPPRCCLDAHTRRLGRNRCPRQIWWRARLRLAGQIAVVAQWKAAAFRAQNSFRRHECRSRPPLPRLTNTRQCSTSRLIRRR